MGLLGTVGSGYDQGIRISGINGYTPEVMVIETFAWPIPGTSAIIALHEAISRAHKAIPGRRIQAIRRKFMHG